MQSTGGTTDMQADDRPSDWRADPPAAERRGSAAALDRLGDPDSAHLPGLRKANDRRSRSPTRPNGTLERAFAMTGLCAAAGTAAGAFLGAHGYGWAPVLGAASFLLLICALTGIRTQELVVQFQRGEVAMVYATALAGPRRTVFDRRGPRPGRMETLGVAIADMLFIGDALFPGGNDYPARQAGVLSIAVRDPQETKRVIETILACQSLVRQS